MPVYRYRSFEDARRALWISSGDADLAGRMRRLWAFAARLCPRRRTPGVTKFRSIEEANRARDSR